MLTLRTMLTRLPILRIPTPVRDAARSTWVTASIFAGLLSSVVVGGARAHVPHDEITTLIVSPAYALDQTVFASISHSFTYLLKSVDGGVTWAPSQVGLPYGVVSALAVSPTYASDGVLFCAVTVRGEGRVFTSADSGASWQASGVAPLGTRVSSIAFSPSFVGDGTVFAATQGAGLFRSVDGGASWQPLPTGVADIAAVALSPDFGVDQTVYAATASGLRRSNDAGASWFNPLPGYVGAVDALALSSAYPADQTVAIGISGAGVFVSTNGGALFVAKNAGLGELSVTGIAFSPSFAVDETLLVSTKLNVYASENSGDLFAVRDEGLDGQALQSTSHYAGFAFSPTYDLDQTVFLASFEGVHRSQDNAATWRHLDVYSQRVLRGLDISPNYANDRTVFSASYGGGVYRSTNGGDSWAGRSTGLGDMFTHPIAVSPAFASDATLFTGVPTFVAKSENRGGSWSNVQVAPGFVFTRRLAISPDFGSDETLFVADDFFGAAELYRSTDGAVTHVPIAQVFVGGVWGLAVSPDYAVDQTVFVGTPNAIYRSVDAGASWQQVSSGLWTVAFAISPSFASDDTILAGTRYGGVFRSTDGGSTWNAVGAGLEENLSVESMAISPEFGADGTVFLGTRARGVYRSSDGGASFSPVGMAGDHVPSLAISPAFGTDATLFAGGWLGTHRSTDGGDSWLRVLDIRRVDDDSEFIVYEQTWPELMCPGCNGTTLRVALSSPARASLRFVGNSVTWLGVRAPFAGIAKVTLDGGLIGQIDLYAPTASLQVPVLSIGGLGSGEHELTIEATGTKNPLATATAVVLDAFQTSE